MTGSKPSERKAGRTAPRVLTGVERLEEIAARLSRTLALARGLVVGGRPVDLTGVDDGIGMLCAQTIDLAPDEARGMLPHLHHVLSQLDLLSAAVRGAHRRDDSWRDDDWRGEHRRGEAPC